jgi:hypothetical protein
MKQNGRGVDFVLARLRSSILNSGAVSSMTADCREMIVACA